MEEAEMRAAAAEAMAAAEEVLEMTVLRPRRTTLLVLSLTMTTPMG